MKKNRNENKDTNERNCKKKYTKETKVFAWKKYTNEKSKRMKKYTNEKYTK